MKKIECKAKERNHKFPNTYIAISALNTDLVGKDLHDYVPPESDFIASIFKQLQEGKTKLTFSFSEARANASQADLQQAYERMNGGN